MTSPARIRLRLLGRLALSCGGDSAPIRFSTRKAGALLAYLALSPEQTATREQLATLLWGSCSDQQARQSLRQALVLLRKELPAPDCIVADTAVVRLQPGCWSVDALEFEALSKSGNAEDLDRAGALFGGEFLAGLNIDEEGFTDWVREQRQRVQVAAARLCETFVSRPDLVRDGEKAIAASERLLTLDPLREDWQRIALTLYARYRGKNEALAQADAFAQVLRRELGVAPEADTGALVDQIRSGAIKARMPPAVAVETGSSAHAPLQPEAMPEPEPSPARRPPFWRRKTALAAAALSAVLLLGVGIVTMKFSDSPRPAANATPPANWQSPALPSQTAEAARRAVNQAVTAIAIVPFTTYGATPDSNQPLADALTDDLSNLLSRVNGLRVISRQTMRSYAGQKLDAARLGSELGVRYVLEGNLRKVSDAWRVNVELIDPPTRLPVWSTRIEWKNDNLQSLGDDIAYRLGRELQFVVYRTESDRASNHPDRAALRNIGWAAIFDHAREGLPALERAKDAFTKLVEQYPDDVNGKAGLGAYHALVGSLRLVADWKQHIEQGEALLRPIVESQPNGSGPFFYLSIIERVNGRVAEGVRLLEQCIEVAPSQAPCYAHLGHALVQLGRPGEGLEHIRYALRLSPQDVTRSHWLRFAGEAEIELKHYSEALAFLRQSYALNPRQQPTLRSLVAADALSGNTDEARKYFAELISIIPKNAPPSRGAPLNAATQPELQRGLDIARVARSAAAEPPPTQATAANPTPNVASGVAAIMVMPFSVLGQANEQSSLAADLMSDDLTNLIGRVGGFRVVSRQTAASYRGQRIDPVSIGKKFEIRYLIEGSVAVQGENLQARVDLIDTLNGQHLWSGRYDRNGADLQALQEEIVRSIGRELQNEITRIESSRDPNDLDVHTLIYKGWASLSDYGRVGPAALSQAEKYFSQVMAREPESTRAMTGLAAYHVQMAVQVFSADPEPHLAKAEQLVTRAMELRPDVGGPPRYMGIVQLARGLPEAAIPWFEREIERNPGHPMAYAHLGRALVRSGKAEEGLKRILYAMGLSPRDREMSAWLAFAATAEIELAHDDRAIEYLDRSLALQPNQPRTLLVMAAVNALAGNLEAARLRREQAQKLLPQQSIEKVMVRLFATGKGPGGKRLAGALRIVAGPDADPWASPAPREQIAGETPTSGKPIIPILVLPLKTFGESEGPTALLADLVTDDLTNLLSRVQFMRVISRQTALAYRGQAIDVAAVGADLHVRYVLDGSLRMQGDKLRANFELIDPKTRLPVWSTRIERDGADRFGMLDELVGRLARELQFDILPIESARRAKDEGTDALIYRGWNALYDISRDGYRRAEADFTQAVARDPQSLDAQVGLGAYHARIGALALDAHSDEHREKALELLRDALARDPQSSTANFYIGLALNKHNTLPQSIEYMRRAIALNPSFPAAYAHIGHGLSRMGKPAEGIGYIRYAMRLSPRDPTMAVFQEMAGNAELELGHTAEAIEAFSRASALKPGYPRVWAGLAAAHALAGHDAEAWDCASKLKALAPTLSAEALLDQFGRHQASRLHRGLATAIGNGSASEADSKHSSVDLKPSRTE